LNPVAVTKGCIFRDTTFFVFSLYSEPASELASYDKFLALYKKRKRTDSLIFAIQNQEQEEYESKENFNVPWHL
jgi:hypothetical protein